MELPDAPIARITQEATDAPRLVIVVDNESTWLIAANGAPAVLALHEGLVLRLGHAVGAA